MSNKTVKITNENGHMALTHEPPVFECTPQLEAIILLADKWGFAVYFNMPLVSGGLEQIEYLSHPAGYDVALNHEPGVIKIYEDGEFKGATVLKFETLVLTMADIRKMVLERNGLRYFSEQIGWARAKNDVNKGDVVYLTDAPIPADEAEEPETPNGGCAICATFFGEDEDVWDEVLAADEVLASDEKATTPTWSIDMEQWTKADMARRGIQDREAYQNQIIAELGQAFKTDVYQTIPLLLENGLRWSMSLTEERNNPELGLEICIRLLGLRKETDTPVGSTMEHRTEGGVAFRVLVPTLPRFPWAYAPEWARFAVKARGNRHLWLEKIPEQGELKINWIVKNGKSQLIPSEFCRVDCDWSESLEANPYYFGFMVEQEKEGVQ